MDGKDTENCVWTTLQTPFYTSRLE